MTDPKRDFVNDLTDAIVALNNAKPTLPSREEIFRMVDVMLVTRMDSMFAEHGGAMPCCGDFVKCSRACYHRGYDAGQRSAIVPPIVPLEGQPTLASLIGAAKPGEAVIWPMSGATLKDGLWSSLFVRPKDEAHPPADNVVVRDHDGFRWVTVPMREVEIRSREIAPLEDHFPDPPPQPALLTATELRAVRHLEENMFPDLPERFVRARALLDLVGLKPREEDYPELAALGERIVSEVEAHTETAAKHLSVNIFDDPPHTLCGCSACDDFYKAKAERAKAALMGDLAAFDEAMEIRAAQIFNAHG